MLMKFTFRLMLLLVFAGTLSLAQDTSSSIAGTVTDPSGAVLPNSSVSLVNNATGVVRKVQTDEAGLYAFPALPPGAYNITVERSCGPTSLFKCSKLLASTFLFQLVKLRKQST